MPIPAWSKYYNVVQGLHIVISGLHCTHDKGGIYFLKKVYGVLLVFTIHRNSIIRGIIYVTNRGVSLNMVTSDRWWLVLCLFLQFWDGTAGTVIKHSTKFWFCQENYEKIVYVNVRLHPRCQLGGHLIHQITLNPPSHFMIGMRFWETCEGARTFTVDRYRLLWLINEV